MIFHTADFFKINFKNKYFRNSVRVSNDLDPDQVQTICKYHQQATRFAAKARKELITNFVFFDIGEAKHKA